MSLALIVWVYELLCGSMPETLVGSSSRASYRRRRCPDKETSSPYRHFERPFVRYPPFTHAQNELFLNRYEAYEEPLYSPASAVVRRLELRSKPEHLGGLTLPP